MERLIKVKKSELLEHIRNNQLQHIEDYEQALVAYKEEALKQLVELTEKANDGKTDLYLHLTSPVNRTSEYDKLILMFEMEVNEEVELNMNEFNQYVHDETDFARNAKFANMSYFKG
jgi:hypothetical protein